MKNTYKWVALTATLATTAVQAQTVSTFENLLTTPDSYWNGGDSTNLGGFTDGNGVFANTFDWQYMFWAKGFAVSNKTDTSTSDTTVGISKMYNAVVPGGASQSASYAIAQGGSHIVLSGAAAGKQVDGMYVTNSNYTYLSMKWGDAFSRQFNDSDYFILNIVGFYQGDETDTTISVYLANGTNLLNTWEWVDLKPLGNVDSIRFYLESSDTGQWGMNTPGFFCIDNFTTRDIHVGITPIAAQLKAIRMYPNPTVDILTIETSVNHAEVSIFTFAGKLVMQEQLAVGRHSFNIQSLQAGIYIVQVKSNDVTETRKLIVR